MLVTGKELLDKAHREGYAVGAFNVNTMEQCQAIISAAEETHSPVIIQASQGGLKYAGVQMISAMVKALAEETKVPVALHLDHGTDFKQIMMCLRYGFTSVMIDASKMPLQGNIDTTKKVCEIAHAVGVSVEAEIGKIGGTEDDVTVTEREATFTDPDEAAKLVQETGVDSLAIAIGTAHGPYKGEPILDFDRLKLIKNKLDMPIVLHGSSGVPEDSIRKSVSLGVNKINIDTDIRMSFNQAVRDFIASSDAYDPRKILTPARDAMKETIKSKIVMFGSEGKA
jgi:fructose-bisphosphate aldolase class II